MNIDELKVDLLKNIEFVKGIMDADIIDVDIESQKNKLLKLTQIASLAAHCKAQAKKIWRMRELQEMNKLVLSDWSPSVLTKYLDSKCADEEALFIYADRLNAFLSHNMEAIRSAISLYKEEMKNNLIKT